MPRQKKQHLKQRPDGRFACRYKNLWFYGASEDEALQARDDYKKNEKTASAKKVTVAEYALKWLPREKVNAAYSTYSHAAIQIEKLLNAIGDKTFDEVKPSDIKQLFSDRFADCSNGYIKSAAYLYRSLFDAALEDGYCASNPARQKSARPHKGTVGSSHRAITAQEREWIETLCTDHRAHAAAMTMLYAGLRPQEAKALNVSKSVDFENNIIRVEDFIHVSSSNHYTISEKGKTARATREVPLLPILKRVLARQDGMLVKSASGGELTPSAWRTLWSSYVTSMEIAINGCSRLWYGRKLEHRNKELPPFTSFTVTPYDLRHSFCTFCRDNDVELHTCIRWMGHSDANMILHIYDEVTDDRSKKEAEKLQKALIRSQNGSQI
jgi:integrase